MMMRRIVKGDSVFDTDHPPWLVWVRMFVIVIQCVLLWEGLPGSLLWIVTPISISMTWAPSGATMQWHWSPSMRLQCWSASRCQVLSKFQESSAMKVSSQDSMFDTGSHVDESFHEMATLMSEELASGKWWHWVKDFSWRRRCQPANQEPPTKWNLSGRTLNLQKRDLHNIYRRGQISQMLTKAKGFCRETPKIFDMILISRPQYDPKEGSFETL